MSRDDADEIRRMLDDRIEQVCDRYFPGWANVRGRGFLAPANKRDLGSFQLNLKGPRRGQWFRFSAQVGGGSVELISYALTGRVDDYKSAFAEARSFLGLSSERSPSESDDARKRRESEVHAARARRQREEREEQKRRERRAETAADIWAECQPIVGTLAEEYLLARGLPVPPAGWPDSVGFHKSLTYTLGDDKPSYPCLVGRIVDMSGETVAVHQIFLDPLTGTKIDQDPNKVTLGPAKGGAIRLGGVKPHINVCEGLETGLAILALDNYRKPVWPCIGTSGLAGVELPLEVQRVTVYPDGDRPMRRQGSDYVPAEPAGRKAARDLKDRVSRFIKVRVMEEPSPGRDYLDVWTDLQRIDGAA